MLVLGAVVVDGKLDVVPPGEPLDAGQDRRGRVGRDQRHAGALRIREVFLHVLVAVPLEGDHAAAHDLKPGRFDLAPRRRQLRRRQLVGQVNGLEVDVARAEGLHHLDRPVARELAQRVARDAELERLSPPPPYGPHPVTPWRVLTPCPPLRFGEGGLRAFPLSRRERGPGGEDGTGCTCGRYGQEATPRLLPGHQYPGFCV